MLHLQILRITEEEKDHLVLDAQPLSLSFALLQFLYMISFCSYKHSATPSPVDADCSVPFARPSASLAILHSCSSAPEFGSGASTREDQSAVPTALSRSVLSCVESTMSSRKGRKWTLWIGLVQIEPSHLGFEYARFAKRALHVISELPYALQAIGTEDMATSQSEHVLVHGELVANGTDGHRFE